MTKNVHLSMDDNTYRAIVVVCAFTVLGIVAVRANFRG